MILKQKPIDQKTDEELEKDLQTTVGRNNTMHRNSRNVNHWMAIPLFAAGWFTAKAIVGAGLASGNPFLVMAGVMSAPAIWAGGAVGHAIYWERFKMRMSRMWGKKAEGIQKEQKLRAFKKTPAYKEILRHAQEEAVRAKQALKDAFNSAVDKVFHGGTENKVQVNKPLQFKKPAEQPKKKFPGMFH